MVLPSGLQPRGPDQYAVYLLGAGWAGLLAWCSVWIIGLPEKGAVSVGSDGLWPARLTKDMSLVPWERVHSIRRRPVLKRLDLLDAQGRTIFKVEYQFFEFEAICTLIATHTGRQIP
jgi:hypothetical protein